MINAVKEFSDIAFQYPASFGVVTAHPVNEITEAVERFMGSFVQPARIRISHKRLIEERVKLTINSVVNQTITNAGLVDMTALGISDIEI